MRKKVGQKRAKLCPSCHLWTESMSEMESFHLKFLSNFEIVILNLSWISKTFPEFLKPFLSSRVYQKRTQPFKNKPAKVRWTKKWAFLGNAFLLFAFLLYASLQSWWILFCSMLFWGMLFCCFMLHDFCFMFSAECFLADCFFCCTKNKHFQYLHKVGGQTWENYVHVVIRASHH